MPTAAADRVDVVIVAHDSGATLAQAVSRAIGADDVARVIVVDNGSRDGAVVALAQRHDGDARWHAIRNDDNPGFATACNQGARAGTAPWIAFVNPDCFVERDTFRRMLDAVTTADGLPRDIGVLGADVRDAQGVREAAARRSDPTPGRAILRVLGLSRTQPVAPTVAAGQSTVTPVDAVSGALMLLPRTAFERLQGFDEGYRLHCEDLDLCRRARAAGLRVAVVEPVRVTHLKGTSSAARPAFVAMHKHEGMWRYYRKFDAAKHPWYVQFVIAAGLVVRAAWQMLAGTLRRLWPDTRP